MRSVTQSAVPILVLLAVAACSDATAPPPSPDGHWRGSAVSSGTVVDVDVSLDVSGGSISGSGFIGTSGVNLSVGIAGTYSHPNVTLNMSAEGFESLLFTGTISGDEMNGVVNGSGFTNMQLMLVRQ